MQQRIGLLYDNTFSERAGGAARFVDRAMSGIPLDQIDIVPCPPGAIDRDCDGYVLYQTKRYAAEEYAFILGQPFIRFEMDYWRNNEGGSGWRDRLNERARLVAFCSDLHRDVYETYHGPIKGVVEIIPPPLDPESFAPHRQAGDGVEREGAIWFGDWHWQKGPDIAMRWAGEQRVLTDFYSPTLPGGQRPANGFCRMQGFEKDEDWWATVARHKTFIHFPRQPEAWPYSVHEAYLLGLDVVIAGRFGIEGLGLERSIEAAAGSASRWWEVALNAL